MCSSNIDNQSWKKKSRSNSISDLNDFNSFQSPVMSPELFLRCKDPTTSQEEEDAPEAPDSFRRKDAPDSFLFSCKDKLTLHNVNKNKERSAEKIGKGDGQRDRNRTRYI